MGQHYEGKLKNINSTEPLETKQWVTVTLDAMAMGRTTSHFPAGLQKTIFGKEREPSTNLRVPPKSKPNK